MQSSKVRKLCETKLKTNGKGTSPQKKHCSFFVNFKLHFIVLNFAVYEICIKRIKIATQNKNYFAN